ncbi:glycosyltransferase family 4 protein [Olsenella sp. YH-ols2217]|uniref:Glycosyltransferase family 4 protein n=1 Tax=Kribbibacterium absianum TaxID=3044210 RepID=A0ABT6ZIP3_9ACTN|nr:MULTISPECIES: glycosyltransferase family 4 protein [unclassified Olsenella]MDJ1121188.1 glycosyltransferase family 4 protein [Olsenella sp. YH-ols2216]MDJ1128679.1 glycosyltransferase family 4 protein [Olsenella sp. YH-ols2217]
MRILNITAQKPDSTGSGVYLAQTVRCQQEAGHETAVICGVAETDPLDAIDSRAAVYPVRFETPELPFPVCGMSDVMPYPATRYRDLTPTMREQFEAAFSAALARAVEEFEPDVVLCHHLYLLTALVREQVRDVPVAAVCHSTDLRQWAQHGLERERIARAMRELDLVLCLTEGQAEQVVETYGVEPRRILVVGAGFDAHRFCRDDSVPREAGSLLYVGKICRAKGVPSLLRAMSLLAEQGNAPSVLRLAGGWGVAEEERAEAEALAEQCPVPVEFLGRLTPDDVAEQYRRAEVFALPSFFEGMPLVLVEAMACGCKAVCTDLAGVRPWIEAQVPGAPVQWVGLPPMADVDKPEPGALPAFEERLAAAIAVSLAATAPTADLSPAAWEQVSRRIADALAQPAAAPA